MSVAPNALGIGAASFWSAAEKDIAESPTALPERPKTKAFNNSGFHYLSDVAITSTIAIAVIASTIGSALGTTHTSWRPSMS